MINLLEYCRREDDQRRDSIVVSNRCDENSPDRRVLEELSAIFWLHRPIQFNSYLNGTLGFFWTTGFSFGLMIWNSLSLSRLCWAGVSWKKKYHRQRTTAEKWYLLSVRGPIISFLLDFFSHCPDLAKNKRSQFSSSVRLYFYWVIPVWSLPCTVLLSLGIITRSVTLVNCSFFVRWVDHKAFSLWLHEKRDEKEKIGHFCIFYGTVLFLFQLLLLFSLELLE